MELADSSDMICPKSAVGFAKVIFAVFLYILLYICFVNDFSLNFKMIGVYQAILSLGQYVDGMGWKSLKALILRAPLCGANNMKNH